MLRFRTFDWRTSPAHWLLLTKFLYPQEVDRLAQDESWKRALGEEPVKAIERFIVQGLLEPLEVSELLGRRYKVSDLKEMLRQRGLTLSGPKEEMISRLIAADPEGMKASVSGLTVLRCSSQGREFAHEYLAREQAKRHQLEQHMISDLRRRKFREAVMRMASYEAEQVFPRGMGIDWKHYNPSRDVEFLRVVFQAKPKRLAHLTAAQLENVRIAVGMRVLIWNVGQAIEWLKANRPVELNVPCKVAILDLETCANFEFEIAHLRGLGCKSVKISTCNDDHVCKGCRELSRNVYSIDRVPALPYERCTSEVCRCAVTGVWK